MGNFQDCGAAEANDRDGDGRSRDDRRRCRVAAARNAVRSYQEAGR